MNDAIEAMLMAAGDGATTAAGVGTTPRPHELDELMEAWLIERGRSIECGLLLDRARRLLRRITAEGRLTEASDREARCLLRAIAIVAPEGHPTDD